MVRGTSDHRNACILPQGEGFGEASAQFDGAVASDVTSTDPRFAETTALVRAFAVIEDDASRARVLALALALAGCAAKA